MKVFKQQCPVALLYLSGIGYLAVLGYLLLTGEYLLGLAWMVGLPTLWGLYIRFFPAMSVYVGYGRIDDQQPEELAPRPVESAPVKVRIYSALGCPFCPVVKQRLYELQSKMGFDLEIIDVTAKPELLIRKGIYSVPVVEVGAENRIGNVSSAELAALILKNGVHENG